MVSLKKVVKSENRMKGSQLAQNYKPFPNSISANNSATNSRI